jgi:hypothetical protein
MRGSHQSPIGPVVDDAPPPFSSIWGMAARETHGLRNEIAICGSQA